MLKIASDPSFASGGWGIRPQTPALLLPTYYYNFVEFISSAKCLSSYKKNKLTTVKCSVFVSFALLNLFFTSKSVVFVDKRMQEYFLPRGTGYPSYATTFFYLLITMPSTCSPSCTLHYDKTKLTY